MGKLIIGLLLGLVIGVVGGTVAPAYNVDLPGMMGMKFERGPQGDLRKVLKKGIRQLKNGNKLAFIKNFMPPEVRKDELNGKTLKQYAEGMPEDARLEMLKAFKSLLHINPVMSENGKFATFELPAPTSGFRKMRFRHQGNKWFLEKA